ncbi:MAG TPA: DUF11 domain-containing protein [Anaerolineae bacterium]|nr:DUF11 domain-containing protein [Anaerolineae bacterium]HIQ04701.1 DUF11 domain-containing protein [Anaerolineae bacterium]
MYRWLIMFLVVVSLSVLFTLPSLMAFAGTPGADAAALPCHQIEPAADGLRLTLRDCAGPLVPDDPVATARAFLQAHHTALGMAPDLSDLAFKDLKYGLASSHVRFRQLWAGYPVFGAETSVHMGRNGRVQVAHVKHLPDLQVVLPVHRISGDEAKAIAAASIRFKPEAGTHGTARRQLLVFPLDAHHGRLAWQVEIFANCPLGDWLMLVDAESGEILHQENRISLDSGSGAVFNPNPVQTSGSPTSFPSDNNDADSPALQSQERNVTLLGIRSAATNPLHQLKGEYVDVTFQSSAYKPAGQAQEPTGQYFYHRDDDRFEEVMVYYHIDRAERYFQSLGFSNSNFPPNGIRDYPTKANAHWYTDDQSFYSTGDNAVHFGDGGVDDAEDADIILHEYGHAVQHDQNSSWGGGEMDAMGEGFGDYLAASLSADLGDPTYQSVHAACVGDWDAVSYNPGNPACLRRVDGNKHYPEDLTGEEHEDGEIWSRALWDIRQAVGGEVADRIILESHFYLPGRSMMRDGAEAILDADQNLYGGAHRTAIVMAFYQRGILEAPGPNFASSTKMAEPIGVRPGGLLTYTLTLTNSGTTDAQQVWMTDTLIPLITYVGELSSSDGGALYDSASRSVVWHGAISQTRSVTITFQVRVTTTISTGTYLTNTAIITDPTMIVTQTATATAMVPRRILLVDDDEGKTYDQYYTAALDALHRSYDVWNVATAGSPGMLLSAYPMVLWLTGDDWSTTLTVEDRAVLAAYLDTGGRLFISGQDIGWDLGRSTSSADERAFYHDYLHASFVEDDMNLYDLTGSDFLKGLDVRIQGGDGASNQDYPSDISPANGGVAVYYYTAHPTSSAAVRYAGDNRAVYFAFGFEAINTAADRRAVMDAVLNWLCTPSDMNCDGHIDAVDIEAVAARWGSSDYDPEYDLDYDGDHDIVDVQRVASQWGT